MILPSLGDLGKAVLIGCHLGFGVITYALITYCSIISGLSLINWRSRREAPDGVFRPYSQASTVFFGYTKQRREERLTQTNVIADLLYIFARKRLHWLYWDLRFPCIKLSLLIFDSLIQPLHDTFIYTHLFISCFCKLCKLRHHNKFTIGIHKLVANHPI